MPASAFPRTFSPIRIGNVQVPNRVARAAHLTRYGGPFVTDDLIEYHVARARAGVGLSILEATAVDPSSSLGLIAYDDNAVEGFQRLVDACRPYGMRVFLQLWHGGHHLPQAMGRPALGVSSRTSPLLGVPPAVLSTSQAAALARAYGSAAGRAVQGGIEGIEVNGAHGYVIQQFLSPITNNRTDRYGGSAENRLRFLLELLTATREQAGSVPIGLRLGVSRAEGDLTEDDLAAVVSRVEAEGLIDFIDITMGSHYARHWMAGGSDMHAGYELESARHIGRATVLPRMVTGRFRNLEEVERAIESGSADLVSMVRALIADPEIVAKTRRGEAYRVRPCIGCNQGCQARVSGVDQRMGCVVNPVVGFERSLGENLIERSRAPRSLLVAGGGVAGMEAARVAATAGHEVQLVEAMDSLGGRAAAAGRAPHLQDIGELVAWYRRELHALGVKVELGHRLEVGEVAASAPDVVIDATGSLTDTDPVTIAVLGVEVPGMHHAILDPAELFGPDPPAAGRTAVVYDDLGQYEALAVAEFFLARGTDVTFVTRLPAIAPTLDPGNRVEPTLDRFETHPGRFTALTRARLVEISADPRRLDEIVHAEKQLFDRIWYHRSLQHQYRLHEAGDAPEIKRLAAIAGPGRARVEATYAQPGELGPYTDFELGMLNGKLSALRWVLGSEWDFLDT